MRFRKIGQGEMSGGTVTLAINRADDGSLFGRVMAMLATHAGPAPEMKDETVPEAIRTATDLAKSAGQDVVNVVDEESCWKSSWGPLET